ncbi:MAG: glucose 1-dehydrogenase [Rhodocyclaceae bacterium]
MNPKRETMNRVQNKVAIVTGGAQGIGRAICTLLAREGAAVAVTDIREGPGQELAEALGREGGRARFWKLDITSEAEVERVIGEVAAEFGRLDILVNNAGIGGSYAATHELAETDWDEAMAVNAKGAFFCTKHAVPHLRAAGGGSIVNIASIYAMVGSPHAAAYHASKGALRILSRSDALAYAAERIRVNSIFPGFIWNEPPSSADAAGVALAIAREEMAKLHPLGNLGQPEDVAYGVLYLASDEAAFVTGAELVIDGGYTAR